MSHVSRIVSLGGSKYRILRGPEAPRKPDFNGFIVPGGSPSKPFARLRDLESLEAGSDERLEDCVLGKLKVSYSERSGGSQTTSF